MSYVTVIWSVIVACPLLLAVMYGCVWLMDRQARAALAFAFEALGIALTAVVELGMMHATSPEEWGEWVRWIQVPILIRTAALVTFIRLYFGTGRSWLLWTVIASRVVILVVGFLVDPNFNFARIDSIQQITFLGEPVTVFGDVQTSPYQWIASLATSLVIVFIIDACISLWRQGTPEARRKVIVIGGATCLSWALGSTLTQLMVYGDMQWPSVQSPPYLIMLAAMTLELSRDTLRASRLARDLKASQARLDVAASAGGLGLWSWESPTKPIWATARAKAMLGFAPDESIDMQRVHSVIDTHDIAHIGSVLEKALATGEEAEVQFRVNLPGGETRWVLARGRAETDASGQPVSIQGVVRDITEQHRAREENEELRHELAHAGRVSALGTLSSSLAHELGQPLAAILLNAEAAEILLKKPNPDLAEVRQILTDIQRDDRRAGEVIDRLRKLLRRGQMDLAPLPVDSMIEDVVSLLKPDAIRRRVALEISCDSSLPVVHGDRVHLSQVLINMIINGMDAVQELPAARRRVSLRVRAADEGWVEMSVADSGPGVESGLVQKIFEPFFTTKSAGMGMGLSVSRTIVEAHGGRLWVENGAEGGATFRVLLPGAA